ncbi:cytidine deaminase [Corynebacterium sp. TA-R-1]|uniref:Cytidine deaminase n=1 Tax=Corynebacterium stercoris TaxID=2943490 RepID=A0ABT1FYC2_9CORY|nr:cytidine deaminase [Corynebacterium stercoris]MCP1386768.1 cytidine deaminase [Corynebacterium stercoris]
MSQPADTELIERARHAQQRSYAPYSQFRVGAALLLSDGRILEGCNFENASYGLAICAERNAVGGALAGGEAHDVGEAGFSIAAVAVVGKQGEPCFPCGACRQVLREFGCERVILEDGDTTRTYDFNTEILPHSFGPEAL